MKKLSFALYFLLSFCLVQAQVTLHSESFETDGEGSRYFSNEYVDCPNSDFFLRTNTNPVTPAACIPQFQSVLTNLQGSFFWAGEDMRSSTPVALSRPPGQITTQGINVSIYNTLTVSLYLATSANNNFRWETADSLNIQASFEGANYFTVGRFMGDDVVGGRLRIDANLDGVISGADPVTTCDQDNFTKYTFSIPGTGTTLFVRLDFDQAGDDEELAIDLIEITGIVIPCTTPAVTTAPANSTTCAGSNTSFSITATGTAPLNYQWQVNDGTGFVNIANAGVYSNATTATLVITNASVLMSGYLYKCIVTNLCGGAASNNAALLVNTNNLWLGTVSTDWHNAANWSCGVPTSLTNVAITGAPLNHPTILPGATGLCRNMLKGGLSLGLTLNGATLKINGNLTYNAGSFITNAGSSFQFTGTGGTQSFGGLTTLTVNNLTINNSNGLMMNRSIALPASLNFQAGKIFTNGYPLQVGSITNANSTNYVVTGDDAGNPTSIDGLYMTVASGGSVLFPIGPTPTSYNPIIIENTSGPAEQFNVFVNATPLPGAVVNKSVQRTWQIDEITAAGGNTGKITLQWDAAHEGASFIRTLCGVYKSDGINVDYTGYTAQNGAAGNVSGSTWSKTLSGITDFSPWGVTSDAVILPIKLLAFNVRKSEGRNAEISWKIADASALSYFELEKSSDAINYQSVKTITSNGSLSYQYTDNNLQDGITYYRLKSVELTGEISYSNIISVNYESDFAAINIYPNPVKDNVVIDFTARVNGMSGIIVSDIYGKKAIVQRAILLSGNNTINLDTKKLTAGLYFIKIIQKTGEVAAAGKFVKY